MKDYTAEDLLEAREKRVEQIADLLSRYHIPILVMRVNYPGLNKTNDMTLKIIRVMSSIICKMFGAIISYMSFQQGAEGPVFMAAVDEEGLDIKRKAILLEERHALGRYVDIDIYTCKDRSISRQELGYPNRTCYLCQDDAHHCVRSKRHNIDEVIKHIENGFKNYRESQAKDYLTVREWTD